MSPGLIYFSRAFFVPRKNIFQFFRFNVAKIGFSNGLIIEGEKHPTGREARRPFSVS